MLRQDDLKAGQATTPETAAQKPAVIVSVCITCKTAEGRIVGPELHDAVGVALAAQSPDVSVRPVECLSVCKRPGTVAISGQDRFTFIFGDLNAETAPAALASFVEAYRKADYGFVPWRARPEAIRRGIIARIPAATWSPADGKPPE